MGNSATLERLYDHTARRSLCSRCIADKDHVTAMLGRSPMCSPNWATVTVLVGGVVEDRCDGCIDR